MTELKKCPFCNGNASIEDQTDMSGFGDCRITCDDCMARSDIYTDEDGDRVQIAIEAWNTRTIPTITPDMVERAYKVYHGFINTGIDFTGWTLQHLINFEKKRLRAAMVLAFNPPESTPLDEGNK